MKVPIFLTCFILLISICSLYGQAPKCQTGPLEGYRGNCYIERMPTSEGFVYTYSMETGVLKKWNLETDKVEEEWPLSVPIAFRRTRDNGRYILVECKIAESFYSSRLFDTQTGKFVPIENLGVFALLPNNLAVVRDDKKKVMLYDMKTNKVKETLGKGNGKFIDVSDDGNIIAWSEDQMPVVKAYDVSRGKIVLDERVNRLNMPLSVSPDGRYVVWCGGINDLKNNKTSSFDCDVNNLMDHQMLYAADGKTGYSISSGRFSNYGAWEAVVVYVREYNLETGAVINEYRDPWSSHSHMPAFGGPLLGALAKDGEHIYFPHKKGAAKVHISAYNKQDKVLDIFGNIGAVGIAQQQAKEQRAKHLEQLSANTLKSFDNVIAANAIFQHDVQMSLWDYDPISEQAMIGNVFEGGLFNTKDGKFITMYSSGVSRPGLSVKTNHPYAVYSVAPGGNFISISSGENSAVYNRSTLIKELPGIAILKLINQRLALARNKAFMLGLYDIDKQQFVLTYRKWTEQLRFELSPDRSKILFLEGGKNNEVIEVASGKTLLRFDQYRANLTDKYLTTDAGIIDIATGATITATGWDPMRAGTRSVVTGNYVICYTDQGAVDAYDLEKLAYVSDLPVQGLGNLEWAFVGVISKSHKILFCSKNGAVAYMPDQQKEAASAYTLDLKTGEIKPFRYHIKAAEAREIYAAQAAKFEREQAARKAQENAGLPECMHNLRVKPSTVVEGNTSKRLHIVVNYDCQSQNYQVQSRSALADGLHTFTESIPKWKMDSEFKPVTASVCSKCNGSGMYTHTVNYSNSSVDNYNANVPGGKVITTQSGSYQKTEFCPVCKGEGLVK